MNTASLFPLWKEEVNRRVAAYQRHKAPSAGASSNPQENRPALASRAAQAAARVAERYAHAPSYSQMLAGEAQAAVRAAKAASKAAQEAHDAIQYVLAGLEAAASPEPASGPKAVPGRHPERNAVPACARAPQNRPESLLVDESPHFSAATELEQPERPAEPATARTADRHEPDFPAPVACGEGNVRAGEVAQPIYANLIQFPREMVATRKMRPRRAEGPLAAAAPQAQLSIFEVDPGSISTQPAAAVDEPAAPVWMRTELSSIELEPQLEEDLVEEPAPQVPLPEPIEPAPLSRRLMALVVDLSLIVAGVLGVAVLVAANDSALPGPRAAELAAALAVLAVGAAYQTLFLTLARATPGMWYAGIGLCTFEGDSPSRAQRCGRLMALPLSVLPLGLGFVWALFDDGRLAWHDRLSQTYLCKR